MTFFKHFLGASVDKAARGLAKFAPSPAKPPVRPHAPHAPVDPHLAGLAHARRHAAPVQAFRQPQGPTVFSANMRVTRSLHTRHGGELQTLRIGRREVGVMTRYPASDHDVADMLRSALQSHRPRVTNLMNRGDMGIDDSYVDALPEGKVCRVHDLEVFKVTRQPRYMGPNTENEPVWQERATLYVRDRGDRKSEWRPVEYNAFSKWLDTTAPPPATYERMWRALYVRGMQHWGVMHCAGGVGRTGTLLFRLVFQSWLDAANARGQRVSPAQAEHFLSDMITRARTLRGQQVMPDDGQRRLLYESCMRAVRRQA